MNTQWTEVENLVRRAQVGDRQAFGELFERFQHVVLSVARRRQRDEHEAHELVQEVFLHAIRKLDQLREPACFPAWLMKITARIAINRATRRPPLPTAHPELIEQARGAQESPLEDLLAKERRQQVRSAVAQLKPIDRDVLRAFYLQGKSLARIAAEFDIPVGTVKRRLHVARHRLQHGMSQTREPATVGAEPRRRKPRRVKRAKQRELVLA